MSYGAFFVFGIPLSYPAMKKIYALFFLAESPLGVGNIRVRNNLDILNVYKN